MDNNIISRTWLALHFLPFIGPARYATEAIFAYLAGNDKKARDKGITSTINGLIDLVVLSLFLISAAHIAVECDKSENLKLIRPLLTAGVVIAVSSILIGSKIIAEQISRAVVEKVLTVHTASSAVVNSVTITATGIEAVVETINDATTVTTTKVKSGYSSASKLCFTIINIPNRIYNTICLTFNLTKNKLKSNIEFIIETTVSLISDTLTLLYALIAFVLQPIKKFLMHLLLKIVPYLETNSVGKFALNLPKNFREIIEKIQTTVNSLIRKPKIS